MLGPSSPIGEEARSEDVSPSFSVHVLPRCCREKPSDEDILVAERGLQRVRDDLAERRRGIERLEVSQVCNNV